MEFKKGDYIKLKDHYFDQFPKITKKIFQIEEDTFPVRNYHGDEIYYVMIGNDSYPCYYFSPTKILVLRATAYKQPGNLKVQFNEEAIQNLFEYLDSGAEYEITYKKIKEG
jgi:hypothetical protein